MKKTPLRYVFLVRSGHHTSSGDENYWDEQSLNWIRRAALHIKATGAKPVTIFHGTDPASCANAQMIAGIIETVEWIVKCDNIIDDTDSDWREDLIESIATSEEMLRQFLLPAPPQPSCASEPTLYEGPCTIIVFPGGLGNVLSLRGQRTWGVGSVYTLRIGSYEARPIPTTLACV